MNYVGCDFHTRFQQVAMVNKETGEMVERRLHHQGGKEVEKFYSGLGGQTLVAMESTGYSIWFHELMDKLGVELKVGDAARIRAQQVRKKKNDREDARLILRLLLEERFPEIWVIDPKGRDLRHVLKQRIRWVRTRTRVKNSLQSLALNHRLALGSKLFTKRGRQAFAGLSLRPHARETGQELWEALDWLTPRIARLDKQIRQEVAARPEAERLLGYPGVGPTTALAWVLVVGPVERFESADQLASYLGLTPVEHSSGQRRRLGRISRQGSTLMRYQLVEAGNSACRHEPTLKRFYRRLVCRRGVQVAKTAVARKLSRHLYILQRDEIDYAEFVRRGRLARCASHNS